MDNMLNEFIKPELLILVPVLYLIGYSLKKTETFRDNMIPVTLGGCGVILAAIWLLGSCDFSDYKSIFSALFMALTQGILVAGASVYINQVAKQKSKG